MAFPSPYNGRQYTIGNTTWEYNSVSGAWEIIDWTKLSAPTISVFTTSGTWTKPTNAGIVYVTCVGAGNSGFSATSDPETGTFAGGVGGAGGSMSVATFDATLLAATISVTVGTSGGNSEFASLKAQGGFYTDAGGQPRGMFSGSYGGGGVNDIGSSSRPEYFPSTTYFTLGGAVGGAGGGATGITATTTPINPIYGAPSGLVNLPILGSNNTGYGAGGSGSNYDGTVPAEVNGTTGRSGIVVVVTWLSA